MDIASQITVSMKPELSKSLLNADAIKAGSILELKILELRGDRALVDFGKFRAIADIRIPVTLGEEFRVRVLESGKQLKMSVISPEPKNPLATEIPPGRFEAPVADTSRKGSNRLETNSQPGHGVSSRKINATDYFKYFKWVKCLF